MECIDACCFASGDDVGRLICQNASDGDVRAALEKRDARPYGILHEKTKDGFDCTSYIRDDSSAAWSRYTLQQALKRIAPPTVFLRTPALFFDGAVQWIDPIRPK